MNSIDHPLSFPRLLAAFFLFLGWFAQLIPLTAFTVEANWKFETLRTDSSEWWQSLSIQTVPGIVYHLQKSYTLAPDDWTTLSTTYGTGAEWICPIFPGSAPSITPSSGTPHLPSGTTPLHLMAYLILEQTITEGTLISWSSMDDQTPKRVLLPGVILDPAWVEFDSGYFNEHGNYLFALSPHLHSPVTFTSGPTTLGPKDAAMIAAFTAALPQITANIQNSVAMAAQFNPQPENPGDKAFYRFSADWSVDSDGDGRLDWQELVLDDNNPFAVDSNGDGISDQAVGTGGSSGGGSGEELPTPTDAQPSTPHASIQQQSRWATRQSSTYVDPEVGHPAEASVDHLYYTPGLSSAQIQQLKDADTFTSFKNVVDGFSIPDSVWTSINSVHSSSTESPPGEPEYSLKRFFYNHARFRLKLDQPAPSGGYSIPMRVGVIRQSIDVATGYATEPLATPSVPLYIDLVLNCPEGQTDGTPVELPDTFNPTKNQQVTFIPASISTRDSDGFEEGDNGTCVNDNEIFRVLFGNYLPTNLASYNGTPLKLHWFKRKLNGGGTFEPWTLMYDPFALPPTDLIPLESYHAILRGEQPGIYQLEARLILPDSREINFPFVRMRDAKSIKNGDDDENPLLKAGQPDYFGVCSNDTSKYVWNAAVQWLGSALYAQTASMVTEPGNFMNPKTSGSPKCNLFVTHLANSVGARTPYFVRKKWGILTGIPSAPIARDDWFTNPELNIDLDIPGWRYKGVTDSPQPGMAVASPRTSAGANHGHVGILDYDGSWISAGSKTVNKYVHLASGSPNYKPNTMRSR